VWQSPDPIIGEYMSGQTNGGVFNPKNLSLFSYTYNNPVNKTDPTGKCVNDPLCDGSWGELLKKPSPNQNQDGVQDKFNFGSGTYFADPLVWEMDESIDIGTQIQTSVNDPKGAMNKVYEQAKKTGESIPFTFNGKEGKGKAFNSDPYKAFFTKAWPFGRVSGKIEGKMTVDKKGNYAVSGTISIVPDNFSWKLDGDSDGHNTGIWLLGNGNLNLGKGGYSRWQTPSQAYMNDNDKGEMPVEYIRTYQFTAHGEGK